MKKKKGLPLLMASAAAVFCCHHTIAQSQDTAFLQTAIHQVRANAITEQSPLFNGRLYSGQSFDPAFSHPFFQAYKWENGSVVYDGVAYQNIPLLYDLEQDELVTLHSSSPSYINLVKEKVAAFSVHGHSFLYLSEQGADSTRNLPSGFYEALYQGELGLFLKREKQAKTSGSGYSLRVQFKPREKYYLLKDKNYYNVGRKSDIFKLLGDKEKELKQYYNEQKLNFKKDPSGTLVQILSYYSQLNG